MNNNIIRTDFTPLRLENTGQNILDAMQNLKVSEIPIVSSKNQFLGLIKELNIHNMKSFDDTIYELKSKLENTFLLVDYNLFQSIHILNKYPFSLIPIINRDKDYIGYIKPIDIINKMGYISEDNTISVTIVVNNRDYNLYELSRLIQENDGKIISFFSKIKQNKIYLNILINCANSRMMIQMLRRYDYDIIETHQNKVEPTNLDDRFESFIKYLNT